MPKYLFHASYTAEGASGLLKEGGSARAEAISSLVEGMGGTLEAMYYAFGEDDLYIIAELPDEETTVALSLVVSASGAGAVRTTVLLDPTTIDAAAKKSANYRPPGAN